ncbi:SHOCT domain-containing protein [Weissella paramesenteroides]|uniref:SHOCT domain-containing protein n=2 Tax=Weissella paramesenteroides TaxID=1249 RepID=UPI00123A37AE|nr:SHOCT domain-containing protein [Weissella paramesenteroides]KAA8458353.1 SHOCT domain-containing protein [Weissella paramesenteroides]KAA8463369.1 SHOCT domain-containing protein [Weissella paramesenteroides]
MEDDKITKLKELHDLYTNNVISESEFQSMKADILNGKAVDVDQPDQTPLSRSATKKSHKGFIYTLLILLILIIGGGAGVVYAKWYNKPVETTKSVSKHKTVKKSSSSTQTSSSASSEASTSSESPKQINLTPSQKEQISNDFLNWASDRATMGNMAVTGDYFDHGAAGMGDWYANTPDGEVQVQDQNNPGPSAFPIHAIGGCVFLTMKDGSTGLQDSIVESTAGGYSDNADMSMPITKYLLGDNGTVYELKTEDGNVGLSTGFGEYSDSGQSNSYKPNRSFIVSKDQNAQIELQQLIKQYS